MLVLSVRHEPVVTVQPLTNLLCGRGPEQSLRELSAEGSKSRAIKAIDIIRETESEGSRQLYGLDIVHVSDPDLIGVTMKALGQLLPDPPLHD